MGDLTSKLNRIEEYTQEINEYHFQSGIATTHNQYIEIFKTLLKTKYLPTGFRKELKYCLSYAERMRQESNNRMKELSS